MRKIFLIIALCIGVGFNATAQSVSMKKDSLKIDSIKKILPKLKTTARIESMIFLCENFGNINALDSLTYYGNQVLKESKMLGYKRGIAMGTLATSFTSLDSLKEKKAKEALQIGKEIGDEEVQGWASFVLNSATSPGLNNAEARGLEPIEHFRKAGKTLRAAFLNTWFCQYYSAAGENEKAFDCARENLAVLKNITSPEFHYIYKQSLLWTYWNLCGIFSAAGDYEEALKYIRKVGEVDKTDNPNADDWTLDISGLFAALGNYDSAMFYWQRYRNHPNWDVPNWGWEPGKKLGYNHLAELYKMNKEYDKAIEILKNNIIYFDSLFTYKDNNSQVQINYRHAGNFGKMVASISLSTIYDSLKNYKASLAYAKDGYYYAHVENRRPEMMQACQLLSRAYHQLYNNDSAYHYLNQYVTLKDSIQSKQFLLRIYNSKKEAEDAKKESRIGLLNRDNQIKQQQLKQEATLRNSLIVGLFLLLLLSFFIFRNLNLKRKTAFEKQRLENQKKQTELEMQALRAQMNPHFIFNCLSSINRFILRNEGKTASNYLTRFSRLMRMVLMNSQKSLISLDDELQMLEIYLEMERLRFKNSFDYAITFLNTVDSDNVFIPPLLLQPFCENAVWHGLMHKEDKGRLDVELSLEDKVLNCTITDNGVGREKAEEMKSKTAEKEKSMGLKITTERLALLNKEKGLHTFYEIEDLKDETGVAAGTKVILKISYKESVEETT
jgi:hypothetical protein